MEHAEGAILIEAPIDDVVEVIEDYEAYPEWADVRSADVRERGEGGRPTEVAFEVDVPVLARPDDEDRWPLAAWSFHEYLPLAVVPFGLVLFANYLVFGFLGWDSDGGAVLVTAAQQLSLLVPIVISVSRTRGSLAPLGLARGGWHARDVFAGVGAGLGAVLAGTVVI